MTVVVRPARSGDIEAVCAFLHAHMNGAVAPARWRRLMDYAWLAEKPDLGRVALDDGRVVGFVGAIYAEREVDGRRARVANLSSWYVHRSYRGRLGLDLLRAAAADPEVTYTAFSPSRKIHPILARLGFRVLDRERYLWRPRRRPAPTIEVVADAEAVRGRLGERERRLLADHGGLNVRPFLLAATHGTCFGLMWVKDTQDGLTHHKVLYLSDPEVFARHAQAFVDTVGRAGQDVFAVDRRLLHGQRVRASRAPIAVPHYFKSSRLPPWRIDHLYSETLLMDFAPG